MIDQDCGLLAFFLLAGKDRLRRATLKTLRKNVARSIRKILFWFITSRTLRHSS
jgi:hypothetical protein